MTLALFVIIVLINSISANTLSADDKETISSQLDCLVNSINSGEIDHIINIISPNARVNLTNEIDTQLRGKKINYQMEIISFQELEDNKIKVKCRFDASGIGWNISGFSNFFIFEKLDEKWLIVDTDFHDKLKPGYGFKMVGLIFLITGLFFLIIIIIGLIAYTKIIKIKQAPVVTPVIAVPTKIPKLTYQGVGIRFIATLIDTILILIAIFLIHGILLIQASEEIMLILSFITIFISIIFIQLYYIIFEGLKGATFGKMLCRICVVKEDGTPCDMASAIIRNLLRFVDGFFGYLMGAIIIWNSDKKQRLGDIVAKTVVVKKEDINVKKMEETRIGIQK